MNNEEKALLKDLPKDHPDRLAVAEQIRKARQIDRRPREKSWMRSRDGREYITNLQGLQATFDYLRQNGQSQTVLDIGTGTTTGICEIAQSPLGKGLKFLATNLTYNPLARKKLGQDNLKLTIAETLRGVPPGSIDCVLAVHSISYSAKPRYVVSNIDRVLTENGIVKAVFRGDDASPKLKEKRAEEFAEEFRKLGYRISVSHPTTIIEDQRKKIIDLLVTVKTPGNLSPEILVAEDKKNLFGQLIMLG